jgi:hypothetical protein
MDGPAPSDEIEPPMTTERGPGRKRVEFRVARRTNRRRALRPLLAAVLLGLPLSAQDPNQPPLPWPQTQPRQDPQQPPLLPNPLDILLRGIEVHPRARSGEAQNPAFQPFPVLTPPGFGAYPGGQLAVPFRDPGLAVPALPSRPRSSNSWPTWLPGSAEGEGGFTAGVAIVIQNTDYVWLRGPDQDVYEPLAMWDRFRVVPAGTGIDVRGGGQFALAFQRGSVVRVIGRCRLLLERLDEEVSTIGFEEIGRAVIVAGERPVRVRLGRAGTVEVLSSRLSLQSQGGLCVAQNLGPGEAWFEVGGSRSELPKGYRVTLMPGLAADGPAAELALAADLTTRRDGRTFAAVGGAAGGQVDWSGARFGVPDGATLRIDPLGGTAFPEGFHDKP